MQTLDEFKAEWEATKAEIAEEMEDAIEAEAEADDAPAEEIDSEPTEFRSIYHHEYLRRQTACGYLAVSDWLRRGGLFDVG